MKKYCAFIIFNLSFFPLFAQSQYHQLVMEGAGIRGLAYAGALEELENRGKLSQIRKVAGTSAGAITALAVSLGYNASEIKKIVETTPFQQFNDGKFFFVGGIIRMNQKFGWYRGKKFSQWVEKLIVAKTKNANITFQELYEQGFRDLYITGTSLNHQKMLVFSRFTYPTMRIKDAVRVSMSIPLYFKALYIDSEGKVIEKLTSEADLVVDGGIMGNFPIEIFDEMCEGQRLENPHTLGLRIDSDLQIQYDQAGKGLAPLPIENLSDYISAFYVYVLENLNRQHLTPKDWQRTISISSGNISPKVKRLSMTQKNLLLENGRKAVDCFFENQ